MPETNSPWQRNIDTTDVVRKIGRQQLFFMIRLAIAVSATCKKPYSVELEKTELSNIRKTTL